MIFASNCLEGRTILVTGASSGIGRETAVALSKCGARLALMARNADRLQETRSKLRGEDHSVHVADLTCADSAANAVLAASGQVGMFHGIFHSAGTSVVLPVRLTKSRHLNSAFGAGVFGAFGIARAAAKRGVMSDSGSVVFMSSVSAMRGRQGMAAYSAAKAAIDGLVRVIAIELSHRRIRVNSIVSGAVQTEMHEQFVAAVNDELVRNYEQLHVLGFGRARDVADAATFLLSDASLWVTGTSLIVDGGYTAK